MESSSNNNQHGGEEGLSVGVIHDDGGSECEDACSVRSDLTTVHASNVQKRDCNERITQYMVRLEEIHLRAMAILNSKALILAKEQWEEMSLLNAQQRELYQRIAQQQQHVADTVPPNDVPSVRSERLAQYSARVEEVHARIMAILKSKALVLTSEQWEELSLLNAERRGLYQMRAQHVAVAVPPNDVPSVRSGPLPAIDEENELQPAPRYH